MYRHKLYPLILAACCLTTLLLTGCGMQPFIQDADQPIPLPTTQVATPTPLVVPQEETDIIIFGEQLNPEWNDWSYDADLDTGVSRSGISSSTVIEATFTNNHGAVQLARAADFVAADYTTLQFSIHGGRRGGQILNLSLIQEDGSWTNPPIVIEPEAGKWTDYTFSLAEFGNPSYIKGIIFQAADDSSRNNFYLDDIVLIRQDILVISGRGPALSIELDKPGRTINPHIYGLNFAKDDFALEIYLPVNRWGGNAVTRYNYLIDVSNRASDWFFLNVPNETDVDGLPDSNVANGFIAYNQQNETDTIMTVPMIGWTPKSREWDCGYSFEKYGKQQFLDPDQRCGNGMVRENRPVRRNDPTDTSVEIDEQFVADWVTYIKDRFGSAENNGVRFYALDNEPMLWHHTHRDVHPEPVGYDELLDLTVRYGEAVRNADPSAKILGPTVWGWTAYFYSAIDADAARWDNPPDRRRHDGIPLVEWYLQQMAEYEAETGTRLLDYLDLHFYPQASEVALRAAGGASSQASRLETTRNLWDTEYVDPTWIDEPIYLIPRMREWVDTHYPGTKLALTEYNWGGLEHINGALAQADVLGIFGREGLDLATLWDPPGRLQPGAFAFRMYRNYDGFGGKFGDVVLPSISTDYDEIAIYAATRSDDNAVTIMVINKSRRELTTELAFGDDRFSTSAELYRYSSDDLLSIVRLDNQSIQSGNLELVLPAESISLYVIPGSELAQLNDR